MGHSRPFLLSLSRHCQSKVHPRPHYTSSNKLVMCELLRIRVRRPHCSQEVERRAMVVKTARAEKSMARVSAAISKAILSLDTVVCGIIQTVLPMYVTLVTPHLSRFRRLEGHSRLHDSPTSPYTCCASLVVKACLDIAKTRSMRPGQHGKKLPLYSGTTLITQTPRLCIPDCEFLIEEWIYEQQTSLLFSK